MTENEAIAIAKKYIRANSIRAGEVANARHLTAICFDDWIREAQAEGVAPPPHEACEWMRRQLELRTRWFVNFHVAVTPALVGILDETITIIVYDDDGEAETFYTL